MKKGLKKGQEKAENCKKSAVNGCADAGADRTGNGSDYGRNTEIAEEKKKNHRIKKFPLISGNTDVMLEFFSNGRVLHTKICAKKCKPINPVMFGSMTGFFCSSPVNLILKNQTVIKVINADCSPIDTGERSAFFVFRITKMSGVGWGEARTPTKKGFE